MAVLTNQQFFFIAGAVALAAGAVAYQAVKLAPAVIKGVSELSDEAKGVASTVANAPLQAFRDPLADASTFGTEAWASQQVSDIQIWLGIGQPVNDPDSPYSNDSEFTEVPDFEAGVIVPYFPEGS